MRILFLIDNLRPGGAQKALLAIATAVKAAGWQPFVWRLGGSSEVEEVFAARGIPVMGGASGVWKGIIQIAPLAHFLRRQKIDILQTFLFHSDVAGRIAGRMAKGLRRGNPPCVVSSVRASNRRNRRWQYMLERATARWADAFTSVSWGSLRFASEHEGVPLDKTRVIPNGIDLASWRTPPRDVARRMLDVPPDDFVIATVGRLHAQKGHKYLLRAAVETLSKQPNATFLIAGYGPLREKLEARAKKLGIARRVRFLGYRRDVERVMAAANVFVLPSLWEGMSNAILEAMAAARPVIATSVDGNSEEVADKETGLLVPPADAPALAEAILRLARDPERATRLGRAGRRRVEELFSLKKMTDAYLDFYAQLMKDRGRLKPEAAIE